MGNVKLHFKCDMCGLCCQNLRRSELYSFLDRGDGVCKYYDDVSHKCSIYNNRPLICNVEAYYEAYFRNIIDKTEYLKMNYSVCSKLKEEMRESSN